MEGAPFQRKVSKCPFSSSSVAMAVLTPTKQDKDVFGEETLKYLTDALGLPRIYPLGVVNCFHRP